MTVGLWDYVELRSTSHALSLGSGRYLSAVLVARGAGRYHGGNTLEKA